MTERLYYTQPGLLEFDAAIVSVGQEGEKYFTLLDRSAFYPTSGGQLFDTGLLNHVRIEDVVETDEGEVKHLSSSPVGNVGDTVHGVIDAPRRKMHRQQHTAQHILSQAFIDLSGFRTVSVHLGEEYGAIELDTDKVTDNQLRTAEERANAVIFDNRPVHIMFVPREEALKLPLRKTPEREGIIRIIRIEDYDYSACGGTHCDSTAQVGMIKIIGVDKMRGHALVNFLAGEQLRADYSKRFEITARLAQSFTSHFTALPDLVGNLQEEQKDLKREIGRLQKELLPIQAQSLAADASSIGDKSLLVAPLENYDSKLAGQLAGAVAEKINGVVALLAADRLFVAAASASGLNAGNLVKSLAAASGLRGGGGPTLAQLGGVTPAHLQSIRKTLEKLLREA